MKRSKLIQTFDWYGYIDLDFECTSQSKGFIVNPHMCRYYNLEQFPGTMPFIFHPEKCQVSAVFSRVSARVDRQPRGSAVPSPAEIEEVTLWPVKHLNEDLEINGTLSLGVLQVFIRFVWKYNPLTETKTFKCIFSLVAKTKL